MLQPGNFGDVFPFVALDTFDIDFGGGSFFGFARLGCFRFGGFLLGVFFCPGLGVNAEGAEVLAECFGGVELRVQVWVVFGEPFGAFLGGAAVFTVLDRMLVWVVVRVCGRV